MNEPQKPKFTIRDAPEVREIYCNRFLSSFFDGGAVTLTFGNTRFAADRTNDGSGGGQQQPEVVVTHRLALSPAATVELMNGLTTILNALKQAGGAAGQPPTSANAN